MIIFWTYTNELNPTRFVREPTSYLFLTLYLGLFTEQQKYAHTSVLSTTLYGRLFFSYSRTMHATFKSDQVDNKNYNQQISTCVPSHLQIRNSKQSSSYFCFQLLQTFSTPSLVVFRRLNEFELISFKYDSYPLPLVFFRLPVTPQVFMPSSAYSA